MPQFRYPRTPSRIGIPVVLLATLGAGCTRTAPAPASPRSSVQAIAWQDLPAPVPDAPAAGSTPPARPCTSGDLPAIAGYERSQGISQSDAYLVRLPNTGHSPCSVPPDPTLYYTDRHGRLVPLPTDHAGIASVGPSTGPATVAPGQAATLLVVVSRACAASRVSFPGIVLSEAGRRIPVPGLGLAGTCPIVHIGVWKPPQPAPSAPPDLHYRALTALLDAPPTARAGAPLEFTVTLTNTGTSPVQLDPCPTYQETIWKQTATYRLNCVITSIPAAAVLRFAMRVDVPASTPSGHTLLRWVIVEPGGQSAEASAPVTVQ